MADRRKTKQKKRDATKKEEPTKEETAVAKHLRFNLQTKKTTIYGQQAEYFTAAKAVDMLLDSKWAKAGENTLFTTRQSVVKYLDGLLQKGLFYRAMKVIKERKEKDKEKEKEKEKEKNKEKEKEKKEEKKEKGAGEEKKSKKKKKETKKEAEVTPSGKKLKAVKRKFKLEPHEEQVFVDGSDAYVWVYDPTHPKTFIMGLLLVIGAAAVCLFPLWPPWMRLGTYYVSLVAACLVGSILVLAVFRCILFAFIWIITLGKHHFWLFPNLMADVGILESFKPVYTHEIVTSKSKTKDETEMEKSEEDRQNEENQEDDDANDNAKDSDDDGKVDQDEENDAEENDSEEQEDEEEDLEEKDLKRKDSSSGSGNGEGFVVIHEEDVTEATVDAGDSDTQQQS